MGLVIAQRRFLIVGGLALVALAASIASLGRGSSAPKQVTAGQIRALEAAALQQLKFPSDFVRTERGCSSGRCYLVAAPSTQVAGEVPGMLRASGLKPPGSFRAAEPVAQLKAARWTTTSPDPLVVACKAIPTQGTAALVVCQDGGRFGPTLVNVLVGPYQPCHNVTCSDPRKTEVHAWSVAYPTGL
jgi:hypothetical protein